MSTQATAILDRPAQSSTGRLSSGPDVTIPRRVFGLLLAAVAKAASDKVGYPEDRVKPPQPSSPGGWPVEPITGEYADDDWHRSLTLYPPPAWKSIPARKRPADAIPIGKTGWFLLVRSVKPTRFNLECFERCERLGFIEIDRDDWTIRHIDPSDRREIRDEDFRREFASLGIKKLVAG